MKYEKSLINITDRLESSKEMYSLICLKATGLLMTLNKVKCYLDGHYMLCLSIEDELTVNCGEYEAQTLHFLPYFYNVNLNHNVIGLAMYEEMRTLYGYPDFHLFRVRDERFFGILRLNSEEYEMAQVCFQRARQHIDDHISDINWSCRTRSDMISILRIAEGAYIGEQAGKGNEILRYIRDNLGEEITLTSLCKQFHTNRTTLTNIIKELTGMSPIQYVLEERLNQSRPDLLFTWVSIQEIAEKYGFDDTNYYIRAFKKRFGTTPLQYRHEGREERIRNETIYHERERKMMSVEDFNTYVRKGLGRAIILLRKQEDKTPYRQPLIDYITKENIRGRFYGEYEMDLINCFDDRYEICTEIANSLLEQMKQGDIRILSFPLLVLMGHEDEAIEIIEHQYRISYAELTEFTKNRASDEKYPDCAGKYFYAASVLAHSNAGKDRIKQILIDMADLFHYSEHPVVPGYQNPLFLMMNGYGKDALNQLSDEVIAEHPCGSKFEKFCLRSELRDYPPKPLESITAEDVLSCEKFDEGYERLFVTFRQADKSVIYEVAKRILEETDRKRQLHWLSFFTNAISPDIDPPAFPLDPTPLIECVAEMEEQIYQEPRSPLADEAERDLHALDFMRHPSVKAFGKKMLENPECPKRFRNYALHMFYDANYTSEDREAFAALLLSENSPDCFVLFRIYIRLIRKNTPDIPLDLIPYVFEATEDRFIRSELVEALIEIDALPKEIKDECQWDCFKKTRNLVR